MEFTIQSSGKKTFIHRDGCSNRTQAHLPFQRTKPTHQQSRVLLITYRFFHRLLSKVHIYYTIYSSFAYFTGLRHLLVKQNETPYLLRHVAILNQQEPQQINPLGMQRRGLSALFVSFCAVGSYICFHRTPIQISISYIS